MFDWFSMLNAREEASLVWAVAILAFVLVSRRLRPDLAGVVGAILQPKIAIPLALAAGWIAGSALLLSQTELWYPDAVKDTSVWFVLQGAVLALAAVRPPAEGFFRATAVRSIQAAALAEFLMNAFAFPLVVELALPVLVVLAVGMQAVVQNGYEPSAREVVERFSGVILAMLGTALIAWFLLHVVTDWDTFASGGTGKAFLLPALLTIAVLPVTYSLGVLSAYEQIFWRLGFGHGKRRWILAKLRIGLACGLRLQRVERFTEFAMPNLMSLCNDDEVRALVRRFKARERATQSKRA